MTKSDSKELKFKFLKLRAIEGKSFDVISKETTVSKATLIKWDKELSFELDEIRKAEIQDMIVLNHQTNSERLKHIVESANKMLGELKARDFKDLTSDKLLSCYLSLFDKIGQYERDNKRVGGLISYNPSDNTDENVYQTYSKN